MTIAGAVALSGSFGVATVGANVAQSQSDSNEYVIIQGDECRSVEPVGNGHLTVEEFYDYRDPNTSPSAHSYSSHGTRHLQEDDTSTILLHEGNNGLSLVVVHERYGGDSDGGAVTMTFGGLPEGGEWVVEDDMYGDRDDEFSHRGTTSRITWVYGENRTDGAAFTGGLDDEFAITVTPRFNENAANQEYDGEITDWEFVSRNGSTRERISLDMTQRIEIRSGDCSSYAVTDLSVNETVSPGESLDVEATVENDGWETGTFTVPITVDGETVAEREVTLEPGESTTVSTSVTLEEAGSYTVGVGDATTEVTAGDGEELPGFGVTAVAIAALLAAVVARLRA